MSPCLLGFAFFSVHVGALAIFAAVWLASVVWTARDATQRSFEIRLRPLAVALALLVPLLGAALYRLGRPCEGRLDRKGRRLRITYLEELLAEDVPDRCGACSEPLEPEFRCCPCCGGRTRVDCEGCGAILRPGWAAVRGARRRRRPHPRRHRRLYAGWRSAI